MSFPPRFVTYYDYITSFFVAADVATHELSNNNTQLALKEWLNHPLFPLSLNKFGEECRKCLKSPPANHIGM